MFDSADGSKLLTAPADNGIIRGEMSAEKASYRFSPHFAPREAELNTQDREQLDKLVAEWRGVRNIQISAVGHTDSTPITAATNIPVSYTHLRAHET